jgi:hypothetical protein
MSEGDHATRHIAPLGTAGTATTMHFITSISRNATRHVAPLGTAGTATTIHFIASICYVLKY